MPDSNGSGSHRPFWLRWFKRNGANGVISEKLEEIIEEREESQVPLNPDEQVLLTNILKLGAISVEDVMVPRADIVAVDVSTDYQGLIDMMISSGHSRLPVYRKSLDDILGFVHIKDVLANTHDQAHFKMKHILRPVIFTVPSMRALDILLQMRQKQTHMALVSDEFGGVDGLVTIEDVVEEIVGEIEDEHDVIEAPQLIAQNDGSLIADARVLLDDFEKNTGFHIEKDLRDDIDTVGGFVCSVAGGRVPQRGEIIVFEPGLEFEVLDADPRKLKKVHIKFSQPSGVLGHGTDG